MFNKLLPIAMAIIFLVCWEAIAAAPRRFGVILGVESMLIFLGLFKLQRFRFGSRDSWLLLWPPFLLVVSANVFLLFLDNVRLGHVLAVIIAAVLYWYLFHLYNFVFAITRYQPLALERLSSYISLTNSGLLAVAGYGFINFVNTRLWQVTLVFALAVFVTTYQFLWVNKIDEQHNIFASILVTIITLEFFWSISLFPVSHFISGFTLALLYYVVSHLTLLHFLDKLEKRVVGLYVGVSAVCVLTVLLSAQWL